MRTFLESMDLLGRDAATPAPSLLEVDNTAGGFPNITKYVNEWFGEHVTAFIGQELSIPSEDFTNSDELEDSDWPDAYEDWASVNNPAPTTPQQKAFFRQALLRYLQANL